MRHGKPGAVSQLDTYDAWYPGYIDYMPMYQNINAWWTETQGGNCAVPRTSTVDDLPRDYKELRPTSLYTSPWAEGTWTLRDAIDYMVTADLATLDYAAKYKNELLFNRYKSAKNTIAQFATSAPYAYVIPQAQHDPVAPVELLRRMAFMGVHVQQLDARHVVRRHHLSEGHLGHSDGSGIRAARARAVRTAALPRPRRRHAVRRRRLDAAVSDGRERRRRRRRRSRRISAPRSRRRRARRSIGTPMPTIRSRRTRTRPASSRQPARSPAAAISSSSIPRRTTAFRLINRALADGASSRSLRIGGRGAKYVVTGVDAAKVDAWAK